MGHTGICSIICAAKATNCTLESHCASVFYSMCRTPIRAGNFKSPGGGSVPISPARSIYPPIHHAGTGRPPSPQHDCTEKAPNSRTCRRELKAAVSVSHNPGMGAACKVTVPTAREWRPASRKGHRPRPVLRTSVSLLKTPRQAAGDW